MGIASGPAVTATVSGNLTTAQLEAVWDALTADHVTASTVGLTQRQLRDAAISGQTASSVMSKLVGMTNGQAVATAGGLTVTDQSSRTSTAENITTTKTPPAASLTKISAYCESSPGGTGVNAVLFSGDSGTTYTDPATTMPNAQFLEAASALGVAAAFALGANSRFRWTTNATAGTYIVVTLGASIA